MKDEILIATGTSMFYILCFLFFLFLFPFLSLSLRLLLCPISPRAPHEVYR